MTAESAYKAQTTEREIAKRIAAAGIRLRFNKVALRLVDGLKTGVVQSLLGDQSIVFTVTAPIRNPAKTSAALQELLRDLPAGELRETINGNEVRARRVNAVLIGMPRVIGIVHNPESNADLILDLAESNLRGWWPFARGFVRSSVRRLAADRSIHPKHLN